MAWTYLNEHAVSHGIFGTCGYGLSHLSLNPFLDTARPDKGPLHSMAEGARDDQWHVGLLDGTRVAPSNEGMEMVRKQGGKSRNQMIKEPHAHSRSFTYHHPGQQNSSGDIDSPQALLCTPMTPGCVAANQVGLSP